MLWIFLPLFLLLLLIAYLLFAPLSIEINTERNWYCLRYHRLASLFLEITDDRLSLLIKVLFWKRRISLEQEVIRDGSAGKVRKVKTNKTGKGQVSWRK